MEKAYDTKALLEQLKGRGLDLAEDAAVIVLDEVLKWFKASAELSENQYDNLVLAILPMLESVALEQIDKIDGKEG